MRAGHDARVGVRRGTKAEAQGRRRGGKGFACDLRRLVSRSSARLRARSSAAKSRSFKICFVESSRVKSKRSEGDEGACARARELSFRALPPSPKNGDTVAQYLHGQILWNGRHGVRCPRAGPSLISRAWSPVLPQGQSPATNFHGAHHVPVTLKSAFELIQTQTYSGRGRILGSRLGMEDAWDAHCVVAAQGGQRHDPAARPRTHKTVSFASTVKFTERRGTPQEQASLSELFVLLLLLALALLAPAGQAIAHVNDIILLYVGYSAIHWVCQSPNSPVAPVADMLWRKSVRGRKSRYH